MFIFPGRTLKVHLAFHFSFHELSEVPLDRRIFSGQFQVARVQRQASTGSK